jgi:DNA polymerase I-like protein with 3'-5' exonuclease and polymerase domains
MFAPESSWKPPVLGELPSWNGAARVSIDTETYDPHLKELGPGPRRGGKVVGYSFAIEDGPRFYVPIRHQGGDNVDERGALGYLRDQAKHFSGIVVGANLSYDLDFLAQETIDFPAVQFFRDIQIADPLIYELHRSYSLQAIAERLGLPGKNTALLQEAARSFGVDPKGGMWRLPARYVGPYGEEDASLPLDIIRRQERIIDQQELWDVYNLESRVLPILVKMRQRGVRIDENALQAIEEMSLKEEADALGRVKQSSGVSIKVGDVWKAEALAKALEAIGITLPRTAKGQPSVKKDILANIDHEVARALERARKFNKLRTTFAASIREHMVNGRIHCNFNQLRRSKSETDDDDSEESKGAAYGRLSSDHPNMQQQPARDEFAKDWRKIYMPDEGLKWGAFDYSQQEPRMVVHFAEAMKLPRSAEAGEKYRTDPKTDNHQMMADLAGIPRKAAKEIFLGLCYGMGGPKLCRKLGLPTKVADVERRGRTIRMEVAGDEGAELLAKFDQQVPFIRQLAKACEKKASQRGYIRTLSGRRCRFPTDEAGNYDWTHKALNRLIQGSSADQTKMAVVALEEAGHQVQLQVHDEIDMSIRDEAQAKEIAEIMMNCTPLSVPSRVDAEIGSSWGDSMG